MDHPNVIFIFSDQQRFSSMGYAGNPVIQTPNFDRLAREGMFFEQAFSSCPICSPYRAQVITGKYSHKNGVMDNEYKLYDNQTTIAHAYKQAGYKTGFIGKWHLGYGPYTEEIRYGFDYMAAYNCNHRYYNIEYWENEKSPVKMEDWAPTCETDLALSFIKDHISKEPDSPFFLMLGWGPPHWPYEEYPEEYNIYDPDTVDMPGNVPEQMETFARKEIAHYYGNITGLDAEMGRLLSGLEKNGLRDDTIVCYSSDHGDHLSSHGYGKPFDMWLHYTKRASKATPYEESIHIPFICSWPGSIEGGGRTDVLFNSVDVMPTLLSLAGIDVPDGIQGTDLSHVPTGGKGEVPDSVYLQILGPGWPYRGDWVGCWRGIRTHRWVYARWFDSKEVLLFDRENDPLEMDNLAGRDEYREIEQELEQCLKKWIEKTEDPFETGERDPETGMLMLGQEFTNLERWGKG